MANYARAAFSRPAARTGRKMRRPVHTFQVRHNPWVLSPFMLAPVVPGETLKQALLQARVVSDPVANPLIGWWLEYWFYYCPFSSLDDAAALKELMIDTEADATSFDDETSSTFWYFWGGAGKQRINWAKLCTKRIVNCYFRDEGELWSDYVVNTDQPLVKLNMETGLESAMLETAYAEDDISVSTAGDNAFTMSEWERAYVQWEMLRMQGVTTQSYEDYLSTYGVSIPKEVESKPELLRYIRQWSYPSNTINPTDGTPTSAMSWTIAERADKDRFFREPGFIIGLTAARPKVYFANQTSALAGVMNNVRTWIPAVLQHDPYASFRQIGASEGPIASLAAAWVFDLKDIFTHGDQFINFALNTADCNLVPLPSTTTLQRKYMPSLAEIYKVFADDLNASGKTLVKQDGVVSLNVLGREAAVDTSPTTVHI